MNFSNKLRCENKLLTTNKAFLYLKQTISYQEILDQKQKQNFTPLTDDSQLHQDYLVIIIIKEAHF